MTENQPDLFALAEPAGYPDFPGSRAAPTSREAARKIAATAGTLRRAVLDRYRAIYPAGMSADEMASALDHSILSIRAFCGKAESGIPTNRVV